MTEHEAPSVHGMVIGILGGTGDQGRGLAFRFALAGHPVIIGSRSEGRAADAASQLGHGVRVAFRSPRAKARVRSSQPVGASSARRVATWFASTYLWCPLKVLVRSHIGTDGCDPAEHAGNALLGFRSRAPARSAGLAGSTP